MGLDSIAPATTDEEINMKNLEQILEVIEEARVTTKQKILISGATHLAQDADGCVFGYKGEPRHIVEDCGEEWIAGYGEADRAVIYCGKFEAPENWKVAVWELP